MVFKIISVLVSFVSFAHYAHALPVDWNGAVGFDTNIIQNVTRTTDSCKKEDGYCAGDDEDNARFQSFILKLNPSIVINDSATLKGEVSTGGIRGGFLGQDTTAQGSYFSQSPSGDQTLSINQFYAELYADTALFRIGKFSKNFGLGATINDGNNVWDRYFSVYNGIEARFTLGKFSVTPFWAKIESPQLTNDKAPNGSYDTSETGLTATYDDPNNSFEFGIYYGIREVETKSVLYDTKDNDSTGPSQVTLIDIFFSKAWEKFSIAMEIPMMSGKVGTIYGGNENKDIDANAYILESSYILNPRWEIGLNAGLVKGEDGTDQFNAFYLHPNYKIAQLMFAYNYRGFQNGKQSIFNSSVTNATYAKLFAHYNSDAWTWRMAFIMANANETASQGDTFYNQETKVFSTKPAASDQSDELGMELDLAFDYQWSPNILVTGYLAYWQVGDFYGFTNTGIDIETADVTASGLRLSMTF